MEEFKNIILEKKGNVAKITINRPPLNIIDIETLEELDKALKEVKTDEGVSLMILTAAGERAFSVGFDVKDHTPEKVDDLIRLFYAVTLSLIDVDKPTIAVVDGLALGGGCELIATCDMVIASERSKFGQPEIDLGVYPPVAVVLFPRLVGRMKALELTLTGERIDAKEAERIGLVNRAVPANRLEEEVNKLVGKLKEKSPIVLKLTRRALYRGLDMELKKALVNVNDAYLGLLMHTEDAVEGLTAFLEKRKPKWKGK